MWNVTGTKRNIGIFKNFMILTTAYFAFEIYTSYKLGYIMVNGAIYSITDNDLVFHIYNLYRFVLLSISAYLAVFSKPIK